MNLQKILKSRRGVALENALLFMLVIFSLCALLTSLTLIGHFQTRINKLTLENEVDLEQIFDVEVDDAYTCFGKARHKAEINLDVIEEKFEDGDLVTLDALKRKKLVPKRTDYVKILARGALTKPLIIEANEFSNAAKDIVELSGGEIKKI